MYSNTSIVTTIIIITKFVPSTLHSSDVIKQLLIGYSYKFKTFKKTYDVANSKSHTNLSENQASNKTLITVFTLVESI